MPILKFLKQQTTQLIGKKCTNELFAKHNFFHMECVTLFLSKALSLGILLGGLFVKVPQIGKVLLARSAQGLSLLAYVLESFAYAITYAYNVRNRNHFTTFGETVFLYVQNIIILVLICVFSRRLKALALLTLAAVPLNYALFAPQGVICSKTLALLQCATIPLLLSSRIPQIMQNKRAGNTGQLSAITVVLMFGGSLARVYTTWMEVHDRLILAGYLLNSLLNGVLLLQIVKYWRKQPVRTPVRRVVKAKKTE